MKNICNYQNIKSRVNSKVIRKEHKSKSVKTGYKNRQRINTSHVVKEKKLIYELLLEKFSNLRSRYKSEEYPFVCDFYIPGKDIYIEYNAHWSHGIYKGIVYGAYTETNPKHQELLSTWKAKANKFFKSAIKTWTIVDPKKASIAKNNDLEVLIFYSFDQFMTWFKHL